MIDIDYFKQYNDTYGHAKGDKVLQDVVKALEKNLQRAGDYLFRMGGEEFCAIFSGLDTQKSLQVSEKLRKSVEELKIPHIRNSVSNFITVSVGLVVANLQDDVIDELGLYSASDNALYVAKNSGRNLVYLQKDDEIDLF